MTAAISYEQKARALDGSGLRGLWQQICAGETPGWEAGKALEYLVIRAFELEGAAVAYPFEPTSPVKLRDSDDDDAKAPTRYEQLDGVVYTDGLTCIVESKDAAGRPKNIEPIAKLRYQLERRPGNVLGLMFSRSGYTAPARILAQFSSPLNILLWDGNDIELCLGRGLRPESAAFCRGLTAKFRFAVTHARPLLSLREAHLDGEDER